MCIIAVCEKRMLSKDEFENCWDGNPDGAGFAYMKGGKVFAVKGLMKKEKAWKMYKGIPTLPHVIHFRIGISGEICKELTHPFLVDSEGPDFAEYRGKKPVLFHNGVIYDWESRFLKHLIEGTGHYKGSMKTLSDTKALAIMLAARGEIVDTKTLDEFSSAIPKSSGKFAMIFPSLGAHGTTCTIGDFVEEKGVYFSNSTYKWGGVKWGYSDAYLDSCYGSEVYGDLYSKDTDHFGIPKANNAINPGKKWWRDQWYKNAEYESKRGRR